MTINILFQDSDFIVVEKPSGLIVHPWSECADKISLLSVLREQTGKYLYPIHRLDRPVSGVMIFAFSPEAANYIKQIWTKGDTQKVYIGLCKGKISQANFIDYPLFNRSKTFKQEAKTNFWPIDSDNHVTLALFKLHTGRYHQIRRHMGAMGNQLIGDTKYGKGNYNRYYRENFNINRLFLHCCGLRINLGKGIQNFKAPLSNDLASALEKLKFKFSVDDEIFNYNSNFLTAFSKHKDII